MALVDRVSRATSALRTPDKTLAAVPGAVRNSIADLLEEQQTLLRDVFPFISNEEALNKVKIALGWWQGS